MDSTSNKPATAEIAAAAAPTGKEWTVSKLKGNIPETYGQEFGQIVCGTRAISPVIVYDAACQIADAHNAALQSDDTKRLVDKLRFALNCYVPHDDKTAKRFRKDCEKLIASAMRKET